MHFRRLCDRSKRGSMAGMPPVFLPLTGMVCLLACLSARAQTLEETQRQFLSGHYDAVIETARKKVEAGAYDDGWRILLVQSLLTVGRYLSLIHI